jgi:hypothetical protein
MITTLKLESDNLNELIKARIAFNKLLLETSIDKDAKSNRGSYLSLEALQEATISLMDKVGLYIEQTTACDNGKEYLITTLRHTSEQYTRSIGYLFKEEDVMDATLAQEFGKIMTYKQRYQWRSILNIGRGSEDAENSNFSRNNQYTKPVLSSKISYAQENAILDIVKKHNGLKEALLKGLKIGALSDLKPQDYDTALDTAKKMASIMESQIK